MGKTVDAYIKSLADWRGDVVSKVRGIVLNAAPEAKEAIKWSQPVYEFNGPFCYIRAFKSHVNFGFWRGVELDDPEGLLQGTGEKMRHVQLKGVDDIKEGVFQSYVQSAVELNRTKGDPTKG
ncbi:MAG: DUF1801 domain-containing protein [Anaerolineales bacterium]|nr:DUF1801 domain-containing protein [Anaerolineales bacterium]